MIRYKRKQSIRKRQIQQSMKLNLRYITLFILAVVGCRESDEEAILGRPEERMEKILKEYKEQLVSSPYGWKGFIFPGLGGGYSFLFDFTAEGRVSMMADINYDCADKPYESSFRLEAVQRPSLFFDTYSYLHILADPDPDTIGGNLGQGLLSDFEFAFESVNSDTIHLKGNQNDTPLILIKASQEEAQAFKSGAVNTVMANTSAYGKSNPFLYIQSNDGKRLNTSFNLDTKSFALSYKQADSLNITSTPFGYTARGIFLQKPVRYRNIEFQEVFYDDASEEWYVDVNGTRTNVNSTADPVLPLHLLLGVDFSVISIPTKPLDGQSPVFVTTTGNVAGALGNMSLGLSFMEFDFNTENKTVNFNVFIRSLSNGRLYLAQYPYVYTKSSDGVFKFSPYDEPNGNAEYIQESMAPLLYYINKYRFRMEYFNASGQYVAQMKCVESPAFYFTANFGSAVF